MLVLGAMLVIYRKRQRQRPSNNKAWERKLLADMDLTTASELDLTTAQPLDAAAGGYSAPPLSLSTGIAAGTSAPAALQPQPPSSAMKAALAGEVDVMDTSALTPSWVTAPPPLPTPSRVIVAGQRCADLASVYRALQSVGFGAAAATAAGQSSSAFVDVTMSDAELVHPERHRDFAALKKSGAFKLQTKKMKKKKKKKKNSDNDVPSTAVLVVFDSSGERLPLLGQFGKLEKLHAALLLAGVPAQHIAFAGTREALGEAEVFAPSGGGLAAGFAQRLGDAQLAELGRHGHVPGRFMVWQREATPAQTVVLSEWLASTAASGDKE